MQAQSSFFPHSGSQLQAAPPLAFSSQYQPCGHVPEPHSKHVPSSQVDRGVLSVSASASLPSLALGFSGAAFALAVCDDSGGFVLSPPQASSTSSEQTSDAGRPRQAGDRGGGDEGVTTGYVYAKYWAVNIQRCPSR
jgi:hypothetical protein